MDDELTLRQAVDAAGEVIFITDPGGVFTFVNREFERLYGYSAPEIVGRCTPRILKSGQADARVYAEWWARLQRGETIHHVFTNRTQAGRMVDVDVTASVVRGALGEITGFLAVQRDVTDQIRAQEALRRSEARYRVLAETATDRIFIVDARNTYEYLNSSAARELGLPGSGIGRRARDCFPVPMGDEIEQLLDQCRKGPLPAYVERRVDFSTGSRWLGTWIQAIDGASEPGHLMGIARDITTQHQLAEQLERQNVLFNAMIEASPIAIVLLTAERWVCDISNRAAQTLGARNLIPGTRLQDSWPEAAGDLLPVLEQALRQDDPVQARIEVSGQGVGRANRQLTVSASRLQLPNRGASVLVMLTDVTERLQLEAQLLQAQKMEAIGRLAGGVAHDFNNLLTPILGYADLIRNTLTSDDPRRADLDEIAHAARSAGALTRQLLTFSRKQVTDAAELDLNDVLNDVVRILNRAIGEDIRLIQIQEPCLRMIRADRNQLEQVLMNVSINARDAMPQGGTLTITTSNCTLDTAALGLRRTIPPGDYVTLSVADTGTGMTPEVLSHLFEPFYTTKAFGKGTGLGLSTVYGIVKDSGGYVTVSSAPGLGTTFTIYFPCVETSGKHPWTRPLSSALPRGTETVLLVEDNDALRRLAERVLGDVGYRVLSVNNAEAALRLSADYGSPIHLLLSDIVMPGQDGVALSRQFRLSRPDTRILFMSGYPGSELSTRDAPTSALKLLQKPFTRETLASAVRDALDTPILQWAESA